MVCYSLQYDKQEAAEISVRGSIREDVHKVSSRLLHTCCHAGKLHGKKYRHIEHVELVDSILSYCNLEETQQYTE